MKDKISEITKKWVADQDNDFSGTLTVFDANGIIFNQASGFRNKAEELPNTPDTAFAMASGTKLFTGIAVCKLIESGKIALDTLLCEVVKHDLGKISQGVTIRHLLTHTSGVGDYIDEDADDMDERLKSLYAKYPPHLWVNMEYYLQMTTHLPPKFAPGTSYAYSNSGYVLLGLVIEAISGKPYQNFVMDEIITPLNLNRTGFFRSDNLPANTAIGYLEDGRTNIHSLPVRGGSDGGLYSCTADINKLWRAIFAGKVLSLEMQDVFLTPHIEIDTDEDDGSKESYCLGVYLYSKDGKKAHFAVGGDSGVGFLTAYYPHNSVSVSCFSNTGWLGFYDLVDSLIDVD